MKFFDDDQCPLGLTGGTVQEPRAVLAPAKAAVIRLLLERPYRACELCDHGRDVDAQRHCICRDVAARATPVHVARAPHGPCGPEARHLSFPGLHA